ncbi:MAG: mandelate racemase/muconate lactonizing enzyme family protein [Thermoguttaceae bacterium]
MRLRVIRVDLPLKHVFTNSRASVSVVRTIIVELEQDGLRGHGEACEDAFYGITVESMTKSIEKVRSQIEHYALADPVAFWNYLSPELGKNRFAQAAVDMAACDLWGKMKNRPLWKIWGLRSETLPLSSVGIGLDSLDRMQELVQEYADWPILKIRLGVRDDLEILKALRQMTQAEFHVDVNGAWETETALSYLGTLQKLRVTLLEQPLHPTNWKGMELLREKSPIPILADESWMGEGDFTQIADHFDGVCLKLTKCGGLTPARKLLAAAKHHGLKISMGNAIESSVGCCATAQLAPLLDYVSLDGPMLIEKKVGTGVRLEKGRVFYPEESGTGVRVFFR